MHDPIEDGVTKDSFQIVRTVLYSFAASIVIFSNIFVLTILPKVHMQSSITKLYLYSLTIADLCTGLFLAIPMAVSSALDRWVFGDLLCATAAFCRIFFNVSSLLSLLAVTVDRFLAIAYPLRYPVVMTRKKAISVLTFIWIVATFAALVYGPILQRPPMYLPQYVYCFFKYPHPDDVDFSILICFTVFVLSPFITTVILYSRLYCITKKHTKFMSQFAPRGKEQVNNNLKFIKTFTLVILCFGVAWLPSVTLRFTNELSTIVIPAQFWLVAEILILSNSGINVFIYCWRNKDFKKAAKKTFRSIILSMPFSETPMGSTRLTQTESHRSLSTPPSSVKSMEKISQ